MVRFSQFMKVGESFPMWEMARVKSDEQIKFDDQDTDYLKRFIIPGDEKASILWMAKALAYRYGPEVLQNPDPEVRDIVLTTQVNGRNATKEFKNVNTHSRHLLDKFERQGIDPARIGQGGQIVRWTATEAARKEYKFLTTGQGKRAAINSSQAREGDSGKAAHPTQKTGLGWQDKPETKDPITFDKHDKEFLGYFDRNPQFSKVAALVWRYSNGPFTGEPIRVKGEQGTTVSGRPDPSNPDFYVMQFSGGKGQAVAVPVYRDKLKAKLDSLKHKGINYFANQLSWSTAVNWLKRVEEKGAEVAAIQPGKKFRQSVAGYIARAKFTGVEEYRQQQTAHLEDKEGVASPNIPDKAVGKWFNPDVTWDEILRQDAEIAARNVVRFFQDRVGDGLARMVDKEELEDQIFAYLMTDEVVDFKKDGHPMTDENDRPVYQYQRWRIQQGERLGRELMQAEINKRSKPSYDPNAHTPAHKPGDDDEAPADAVDRDALVWKFADKIEDFADTHGLDLPPDVEVEELARELVNKTMEYMAKHGGTPPSVTAVDFMIRDILQPHTQPVAMAARTKKQPNFRPPTPSQQPPQPPQQPQPPPRKSGPI